MLLPGIGPTTADRIIAYREACTSRPAFSSADDLDLVERIGPLTIEKLRRYLSFPSEPPPQPERERTAPVSTRAAAAERP